MSRKAVCEAVLETINKNSNFTDQIAGLTVSMIDLDEDQFEKIIASNILKLGFEETMVNIVYPFLSRIGFLWQTDSINPSQEHFITNLIRQKLIVAIDSQYAKVDPNGKKFMLYLPEGELHEISLLFASYLIRVRNNKAIYLGQSLPIQDVKAAINAHKPDYLLTVVTSSMNYDEVQQYIYTISKEFADITILMSGYQVIGQDLETPENVEIIPNFRYLIDLLGEISLSSKKVTV